jgi:hypothetical protein
MVAKPHKLLGEKNMVKILRIIKNPLPIYLNATDMHWWLRSFVSLGPCYPSSCFWNGGKEINSTKVQINT